MSVNRQKLVEQRLKANGLDPSVLTIGDKFEEKIDSISTGFEDVDYILGDTLGIPKGSIVELCGDTQSGKSFFAQKMIAECHKLGLRCAYLDAENAFYSPRAKQIGVNIDNTDLFEKYDKMETSGQYGDWIIELANTGEYALIVLDSLQALTSEADYSKSLNDAPKIGSSALTTNRMLKKLLVPCAKNGTIFIFINQFRMGAGLVPHTYVKKPGGGESVGYFCHIRLWFTAVSDGKIIGDNGKIVGAKTRVLVNKTRYGIAKQICEIPIYFYSDIIGNPIEEFLSRASDSKKQRDYVKIFRKKYTFFDPNTGEEKCSSKDALEFCNMLLTIDVEYKNKTWNAVEYIAERLRMDEKQLKLLIERIENPIEYEDDNTEYNAIENDAE